MSKNIKLTLVHRGKITLGDKVDITDPCYKRDVWCRMNDIPVEPGQYNVATYSGSAVYNVGDKEISDFRNWILCVYKGEYDHKMMEEIGEIGVDAGLAGVFPSPFVLNDDLWNDFVEKIHDKSFLMYQGGCCSSSGFGDGVYSVFAIKNAKGEATAIEIRFGD